MWYTWLDQLEHNGTKQNKYIYIYIYIYIYYSTISCKWGVGQSKPKPFGNADGTLNLQNFLVSYANAINQELST